MKVAVIVAVALLALTQGTVPPEAVFSELQVFLLRVFPPFGSPLIRRKLRTGRIRGREDW